MEQNNYILSEELKLKCINQDKYTLVFDEMVKKPKVAIYVRVSTEEQAKSGFSISAQIDKLSNYSFFKDYYIADFYIDDGKSGKDIDGRPQVKRMLKDIADNKVDIVLVYKLDRLTRSLRDLMNLVDIFNAKKCEFVSFMENIDTQTATGRMFIQIIGIFAEFERENLIERVKTGLEKKAKEGYSLATWGASYGYDLPKGERILQINEQEAKIIKYIFDCFTIENTDEYKIAKLLNGKGVKTKRGRNWAGTTVQALLTNPTYIGKIRHHLRCENYQEYEGKHESIITDEQYEEAQSIIAKKQKRIYTKHNKENSYFKGFLKCSECGGSFTNHHHIKERKDTKTREDYITYKCMNKGKTCTTKGISHIKLEQAFVNYINNVENFKLSNTPPLEQDTVMLELEEMRNSIKKELETVTAKKRKIMEQYLDEMITYTEYKEMVDILLLRETELSEQLNLMDEEEPKEEITMFNEDVILDIKRNWESLTDEEKLNFLTLYVDTIELESIPVENKVYGKVLIKEVRFYK